jgi:hypothetical protein
LYQRQLVPLTQEEEFAMNVEMTERVRLIIDTEEEVRLAVRLAATKLGMSTSEWINALLRRELEEEIEVARRYTPDKGEDDTPPRRKKRGGGE